MKPDHNLLVAALALRMNLVSRDVLIRALHVRDEPLEQVLLQQGALSPHAWALLDAAVQKHLQQHEDTARGLEALGLFVEELTGGAAAEGQATVRVAYTPAGPSKNEAPPATDRLGARFRILRPHAQGGLGQVYVAFDKEMHREVALKEIRPSHADVPESRARFLLEAEVTGGLEHPGIVPVYSLGTYADGRPYYAMRFIHGEGLDQAIQRFHEEGADLAPGRRRLALRELLGRFIAVCHALAYAHARGVIHRDVKPSNIMLGAYGETLLVDWGLAKAFGQQEGEAAAASPPEPKGSGIVAPGPLRLAWLSSTSATLAGLAMGTPGYMSPEQAEGKVLELGPASDVYSLGATLYCLLTGRAPFEPGPLDELLEGVQTGGFPPPREVNRAVPRALEAICLRAMRRAPQDRYASAHELADDLERWLADEPVSGYPEPILSRCGRWARRHRSLVAAATVLVGTVVVALAVGAVLVWREKERTAQQHSLARKNLELALGSVDSMLTEVAEKGLADEPRMEEKRRNLLAKARSCYVEFLAHNGDDPGLRLAVALAHKRLADIDRFLGRYAEAESSYRQAIGLLEELTQRSAGEERSEALSALGQSHNYLGEVCREMSRREEASAAYRQALRAQKRLAIAFPHEPEYQRQQGQSHDNLCILHRQMGRPKEALASSDQALALLRPLATRPGAPPEHRKQLARAWLNRGTVLQDEKRLDEAAKAYTEAIRLQEALVSAYRDRPDHRYDLAASSTNLGILERSRRNYGAAERAQQRARGLLEGLARDYPRIPRYRADLANFHNSLGALHFSASQDQRLLGSAALIFGPGGFEKVGGCAPLLVARATGERGRLHWLRALEQFNRLVKAHSDVIDYRARRGMVLINLARLERQREDLAAAEKLLALAGRDVEAAYKAEPANDFYKQLREIRLRLARDVKKQKRL